MRLRVMMAASLAFCLAAPAANAWAAEISVSPGVGPPGTVVTVAGKGFRDILFPLPVSFWEGANGVGVYEAQIGTVPLSAAACAPDPYQQVWCDFTVQVTIPPDAPTGDERIVAGFPIAYVIAVGRRDTAPAGGYGGSPFKLTERP